MATPSSYYEQVGGQYRVIPGAGTYLADQSKAQNAYEKAKAQLAAQRSQKQIASGLNQQWDVDPNAQYGTYQQMLQNQGSELNQAQQVSQERGFFGPGLGNQGQSGLRYAHAVQSLGFKNTLADWESQYQGSMGDLERQRQDAMLAALQDSASNAFDEGDFTPYDPTTGVVAPPPSTVVSPAKAKPPPKKSKPGYLATRPGRGKNRPMVVKSPTARNRRK